MFYKRKGSVKGKSMFLRFLISYFVILTVPLATTIFTFYKTTEVVKNETTQSNAAALKKLFQIMDTQLINMEITALKMGQDGKIFTSAGMDYTNYQIKTYLQTLPKKDFSDIFIYYKNPDFIISSNNSKLSSKLFYESYYQSSKISYEEWHSQLQSRNNLEICLRYVEGEKQTLSLLQSFPLNSLNPTITIEVVMSPSFFNDLFKDSAICEQGEILMFNKDKKLLTTSNNRFSAVNLDAYTGQELYYDSFEGQECVVQIFPSSSTKYIYVSVIPTSIFWEKADSIQYTIVIGLLISLILGGFLVIMLTRYNYKPITGLLGVISSKTNIVYETKRKGEIEYIDHVLNSVLHEKNTLDKKFENDSRKLRDEFLFQALRGISNSELNVVDYFAQNGFRLNSEYFCVVLLKVESCDSEIIGDFRMQKTKDLISFIMHNVLEEFCAEKHLGYVLHLEDHLYACLVNFSPVPNYDQDVHMLCEKAVPFFLNSLGIQCSASIGNIYSGEAGIHKTYLEALTALEYCFIFGKNTIISYQDIYGRTFKYHYDAHSCIEQILTCYIKGELSENPKEIINTAPERFFDETTASLEVFKCFQYDMVNLISKIANENCIGYLHPEDKIMESLIEADSFVRFKELFLQLLLKLHGYYQGNLEQNVLSSQLIRYIDQNYSNTNLNLNIMADYIHLTPYYLSKTFKSQTGLSPLEYLGKVRISNAKSLLHRSNYSVEVIAARTGYLSSSVFIRNFKKSEGITPGAYKAMSENTISDSNIEL